MALAEDAASVLEQFVQDVANLPAEIAHLLEEIQAKDRVVAEHRSLISARDTSIQKHLKSQNVNCANPHPKDEAYCKAALSSFDRAQAAQSEKVALSDKAALLLDRQIKRLDFKIRDLQNEGSIQPDPQLPSLLTNTSLSTRLPPLSSATSTAAPTSPHLGGSIAGSGVIAGNPLNRLVQPVGSAHRHPSPLQSTAGHAHAAAHNLQGIRQANRRSPSTDTSKRRRLNHPNPLNAPATSSSLRQSSLGPGTPRGGLDGTSRGSSTGPARPPKKGGPNSRTGTGLHNSTSAGHANNVGSASAATKKSLAATARRRGGGGRKSATPASQREASAAVDEDEDAEMEDVDNSRNGGGAAEEDDEEDEEEEDEDGADDKKYCTCRSVSYGNMVACDNEACPFEWFHWSCVGIKAEPQGKWFCPECRVKTREGRAWVDSLKGH